MKYYLKYLKRAKGEILQEFLCLFRKAMEVLSEEEKSAEIAKVQTSGVISIVYLINIFI